MTELSDVQLASERHKAALLRNERAAASDMVRVYGGIWRRVKPQLDALLKSIDEAERRGEEVKPSDVARSERLRQLLAQVEQEVGQYAQYADASIRRQQSAVIEAAAQNAEDLTRAALGDAPDDEARLALRWNRLPREAMVELVGQLHNGAPLDILLGELGPEASQRVKDALLEGLAMGRNPRVIARDVRRSMGMPLTRSLRISRTEVLRAHRLSTLASYQANSDIIRGWRWSASHSSRTCLACLAMDGKVFPLDKPPPMHVQCRCSCIPVTVSWRDLGVDAPEPDLGETGAEWFASQPASVQREMMGDEAYKAYKAGRVTLDDFVGVRKSRRWGESVGEVTLKDALGQAGKPKDWMPKPLPPVEPKPAPRSTLDNAARIRGEIDALHLKMGPPADLEARYALLLEQIQVLQGEKGKLYFASSDEDKRRRAEIEAAIKPLHTEFLAVRGQIDKALEARNAAARALLYVDDPASFRVAFGSKLDEKRRSAIERGLDEFRRLVSADVLSTDKTLTVKAGGGGRSHYPWGSDTIAIATAGRSTTTVHELGHWLEEVNPGLHDKIMEFYDRRTAGEKLITMNKALGGTGYRASEKTRPDKFVHPYMGKDYQRKGSEILSMGLEMFYSDPHTLATKDPEYFDFIYNLVRGR